jgi:hypothetical protein
MNTIDNIHSKLIVNARCIPEVFIYRCSMWLPWVTWQISHLYEISSLTLCSISLSTSATVATIRSQLIQCLWEKQNINLILDITPQVENIVD